MSPRHRILLAVLLALPTACAPFRPYEGKTPAPGAVTAFEQADSTASAAAGAATIDPRLLPVGTDRARHYLGALRLPAGAESLVVILYGDNRPGFRMQTHPLEYRAVRGLGSHDPRRWLHGLLYLPLFAIEAIVPSLDGPRDLISRFTHRPRGGGEKRVLGALEKVSGAGLVVSTGDLVTDGRRGRQWEDFAARHARLRTHVLYLAAPGNHERMFDGTARSSWNAVMGGPAEPERYWYAVDVPEVSARFVFLDSNVLADVRERYDPSTQIDLSAAQMAWADSILDTPLRYKFVVMHDPLVSAGHYLRDWTRPRPAARRARLLEIFARRRVTALICGHEHLYQRVYMRSPGGGLWHLTTGGGGAPLYPVQRKVWETAMRARMPAPLSLDPRSAHIAAEYHYCRLTLPRAGNPEASLPVEVRRVFAGGRTARIDAFDLAHPPSYR